MKKKSPPAAKASKASVRKRSFPQRDRELIRISELHLQGFSQSEIAMKMGLSQPQISRDLAEISKRIEPSEEADKQKLRKNWLDKNKLIEKKLWTAFEKSTEDKEVQTKKQIAIPEGGDAGEQKERMEASVRSEGQCGNASFIEQLGKCMEREAKMLGLYPAQKHEHALNGGENPVQIKFIRVKEPIPKVPKEHPSEPGPKPVPAPPEQAEAPAQAPVPETPPQPVQESMAEVERRLKIRVIEPPVLKKKRLLAEFMEECGQQDSANWRYNVR
jgi:transcriptional regulator with XRE-family HTH domain